MSKWCIAGACHCDKISEVESLRAERNALKAALDLNHTEIIGIHRIMQGIADCPPSNQDDSLTLKAVKNLCLAFNSLSSTAIAEAPEDWMQVPIGWLPNGDDQIPSAVCTAGFDKLKTLGIDVDFYEISEAFRAMLAAATAYKEARNEEQGGTA